MAANNNTGGGSRPQLHKDGYQERPYRSHLRPACLSCRRRKSRCKTNEEANACVMCQVHGTECIFPNTRNGIARPSLTRMRRTASRAKSHGVSEVGRIDIDENVDQSNHSHADAPSAPPEPRQNCANITTRISPAERNNPTGHGRETSKQSLSNFTSSFAAAEEEDSHIVGPAMAVDSEILEHYLSTVLHNGSSVRMIRTSSESNDTTQYTGPIMFTAARRRPLGLIQNQFPTANKCEMVEKLVEPHLQDLVDLYFEKVNICFPLLDAASFKKLFSDSREKISPALLSNLYSNSMIYWPHSPSLSRDRCPDIRFCWLQSCEALHSELFLSPGISAIIAILLNVGGRPSTSVFGNAGLLGTAVALSHALGLNRNPWDWNLSSLEKWLRVRIWWALLLQDRWYSLAYGTPPQIHTAQHDVPAPTVEKLCKPDCSPTESLAASIFVSLWTLTEVLGHYLEYVYNLRKDERNASETSPSTLELLLSQWEGSLDATPRNIILHGNSLDAPGAANLRLAYLTTRLLLRRIQLDLDKQADEVSVPIRHAQAEIAAEDIVHFVQTLEETHLTGFWFPTSAFSFTSATTFLLRSALKAKDSSRNGSLASAKKMIEALQSHRQKFNWDLADNCLGQYADIVEKISTSNGQENDISLPDFEDFLMFDVPGVDDLFPSLWDTLGD